MSPSRFIAAALCAAALVLPAAAAPARDTNSLDEVILRVQEQQKKTNSLEADFRQEKTLALLANSEVSTGHFVYSKPNSVLWEYDAPKHLTMLIANGTLTTYYPELHKAETIEIAKEVTNKDAEITARVYDELMPMLSDDGRFAPAALATLAKSYVELQLLPQEPDMTKLYTQAFLPR